MPTIETPLIGRHPWYNAEGKADARIAGIWMANLLLTAGVEPWRAFLAAGEVSKEIAQHPERFRTIL